MAAELTEHDIVADPSSADAGEVTFVVNNAGEETHEIVVDLEAGSYVLACNVVEEEDGETEAHYAHGMYTSFEVT